MGMLLYDRRRRQREIDDIRVAVVRLYMRLGLVTSLIVAMLYYIIDGGHE